MRSRRTAALVVCGVLGLGGSACGGGDQDGGGGGDQRPATAAPEGRQQPTAEQREALQGFTDCLREQGVDVPDPSEAQDGGQPPFDPSDPQLRQALDACRDRLPADAAPDTTP